MGFFKKEKEEMKNKDFCEAMINSLDREMAKMLAMVVESTGLTLNELDPEQVRVYNECIRFWNEYKENMISWAEYQDTINSKNKIVQQTMCGMIENNHKLLMQIQAEQHEYFEYSKSEYNKYNKGGDRS